MKKWISIMIIAVLLLTLCGCKGKFSRNEINDTLTQFIDALKTYDGDEMARHLTAFPDNGDYVYLDDIFNDEGYVRLYRIFYDQITWELVSVKKDKAVIKVKMPNVQNLFSVVSMSVMNMVMSDEALQDKLDESDEYSLILLQESMIAFAEQGNYSMLEQTFTLSFGERGGVPVIVCDDELRAFMTGNLFLSKNITKSDVASN